MYTQAHPGLIAGSIPWLSGADFKRTCAWMPYVSSALVLTRDRGCGRVTIGRDGLPRLHYWPDAHDRESMMRVCHPNIPPLNYLFLFLLLRCTI